MSQDVVERGNNQACASIGEQIWEVCRGQEVGATHFEPTVASDFHVDNTSTTMSDNSFHFNSSEGKTDSDFLDEAIATTMEQTVGLNLATLVSLFAEKIATGTSPDG